MPRVEGIGHTLGDIAVERLARLAAQGEADQLHRAVEALLTDGLTAHNICHHHLTLAARRLGEWWNQDRVSFCDVTLAMLLLRGEAARLARSFSIAAPRWDRTVFVACAPGEQHRFGAQLLADTFRGAGWGVQEGEADEAISLAADGLARVVALAAGSRTMALALSPYVRALRGLPRRPGILVGGPAFLHQPELVRELGADATASDATAAVAEAEALVGLLMEVP